MVASRSSTTRTTPARRRRRRRRRGGGLGSRPLRRRRASQGESGRRARTGGRSPHLGGRCMIALLLSASVAFLLSVFGTPFLIRVLRARGIGQTIRDDG